MWAASPAPIVSISAASAASSLPLVRRRAQRFRVRSSAEHHQRKKVVVVGAGWAGLASAHHLLKQGFDVTLLEAGGAPTPEVGIRGIWYPYRNIFSLVDELGIQPFTKWTKSAHYSPEGMEVQFPVFQNQPQLPTPFGAIVYPQFLNLPLLDRLTSVPLIAAVIDFDNTDSSWRKYDPITSRELLKQFGCSEMLFRKAFEPLLQVGLFAPAEQCSAAATLAMLYYYFLSHQYYANQLLHLKDDEVVAKVLTYLSSCVTEFREAIVVRQSVSRFPNSATHFFPGSYRYMMRGSTSFPNLFMAGDWIINRHGSWSQEKAYVTGLEAANRVVDFLGVGEFAKIIAIEEDEPHIQTLRSLNRNFNETKAQLPLSSFFLQ